MLGPGLHAGTAIDTDSRLPWSVSEHFYCNTAIFDVLCERTPSVYNASHKTVRKKNCRCDQKRWMREAQLRIIQYLSVEYFPCRMEDRGEVISIKFSYDMKVLAIQRSHKSVVRGIVDIDSCWLNLKFKSPDINFTIPTAIILTNNIWFVTRNLSILLKAWMFWSILKVAR